MIGYSHHDPKSVQLQLTSLTVPLAKFKLDCGRYPLTEDGLKALICKRNTSCCGWKGPYIGDNINNLNDAWNRPFVYNFPSILNKSTYDLFSLGPDGIVSNDDIHLEQLK